MDCIHFCDLVGTAKEEPSKISFSSKLVVFFLNIGGFSGYEASQELWVAIPGAQCTRVLRLHLGDPSTRIQ